MRARRQGGASGESRKPPKLSFQGATGKEEKCAVHPSSVNSDAKSFGGARCLVYHELVQSTAVYLRDCTAVGSYPLLLSGSYNVKFTMDLACKDLGLVNGIAEKLGVPLELGSMAQQIFRRARGLMGGNAQSPEVVRMIEKACDLELRAPGYPTELVAK